MLDQYTKKTSNVFTGYSREKAQAQAERLQKLQEAEAMEINESVKTIFDTKGGEISGRGKGGKVKKSKKEKSVTLSPKRSFSVTFSPKKTVSFSPEKTVKMVDPEEKSSAKCDLSDFFNSLSELEMINDDEKSSELAAIQSQLEAGLSAPSDPGLEAGLAAPSDPGPDITQPTPQPDIAQPTPPIQPSGEATVELTGKTTVALQLQTDSVVDTGNEMKQRKRKSEDGALHAVFNSLLAKKPRIQDFKSVALRYFNEEGIDYKKGRVSGRGRGRRTPTPPLIAPRPPQIVPKIPIQNEPLVSDPGSGTQKVRMNCNTVEVGKTMSVDELSPKQRQSLADVLAKKGLSINENVSVRFDRDPNEGSLIMKVVFTSQQNPTVPQKPMGPAQPKKGVKFSLQSQNESGNKTDQSINSGKSDVHSENKGDKMVYIKDPSAIKPVAAQPTSILKSPTPSSPPKCSGESATIVPQYGTPGRTNVLRKDNNRRVFVSPLSLSHLSQRRPSPGGVQGQGHCTDAAVGHRFSPMRPMSPGYKTVDSDVLRGLLDPGSPYEGRPLVVRPHGAGVDRLPHSRSVPEMGRFSSLHTHPGLQPMPIPAASGPSHPQQRMPHLPSGASHPQQRMPHLPSGASHPQQRMPHLSTGPARPQQRMPHLPIPKFDSQNMAMPMQGIPRTPTSLQNAMAFSSLMQNRPMFPMSMQGTPNILPYPHAQWPRHPNMPIPPLLCSTQPSPSRMARRQPGPSAEFSGHPGSNAPPLQQRIKSPVHALSVHNISLSTQQNETPQRSENKVMIAQPSVQQASSPAFMPRKSHVESPIRGPAKPVLTDDQPTDLSLPAPLTEALDLSIPSPKKDVSNPVQGKDNSQSSNKNWFSWRQSD